MVMKSFVRALTSLLLCLLASCKLDYSMVRVAPPGVPVAHVVSAINHMGEPGAIISKVNGKGVRGPNGMGYEIQVPAGRNTLFLAYFNGMRYSLSEQVMDFEEGGYYVLAPTPDFDKSRVRYTITRVTPEQFQISMCRAQRQVHQAMKSINPQKTPACDALPAQSRQG